MKPPFRAPRRLALLAILCATAGVHSAPGAADWTGSDIPRGFLAELAREADAAPAIAPRLSISSGRAARRTGSTASGAIMPGASGIARSGSAGQERLIRIVGRAKAALREGDDPGARHALALVDVLWGTDGGKPLDAAISSLRSLTRVTDRPAPVLADLSAAYLVRSERNGTSGDLLSAMEAAEEALEHSPSNRAARFNRALAIHRFGLREEAAAEWRGYLGADSTSRWADDARHHLRGLLAAAAPAPRPAPAAPLPEYAAYAAADPQGARVLGWCTVLGAWAEAWLAGDPARADAHLRRAETLGGVLERHPGGDASLADAARAVRAAGKGPAGSALARAHGELSAGCVLEDGARIREAAPRYAAAAAAGNASPVLTAWARLLHGRARFRSGDAPGGEAAIRRVLDTADPDRHPALAARAMLSLASLRARGDRYETALTSVRQAARLFSGAGEHGNEAAALETLAFAQLGLGDMDEGYATVRLGLERMHPNPAPNRLHALLTMTAYFAAADGLARAAVRIQDEAVRAAHRTGKPGVVAESRLARSRLLFSAGALRRAREDLAVGRRAAREIEGAKTSGWSTAERQLAEAPLASAPARAVAAFDSAAAFFLGMHAPLRALPAVVGGAEARLAAGDRSGAAARLELALSILEQRRDSVRVEARRAAVFDAARAVVDRMVALELAAGRPAAALEYLDRGRASLATVGRNPPASGGPLAGPAGAVVVEYALVGDTLLVWTIAGRKVALFRKEVDAAALRGTIEHLRSKLETPVDGVSAGPALSELYDQLVRPVRGRLGPPGTPVVVVADGELASIPFAALLDAPSGRYLVEDHPLRFAVSLREAARGARPPGAAGGGALFVADPAFDPREHPGLDRLEHANGEVRAIRGAYPRFAVLANAAATREALEAGLARAEMVHYAGHAIFDDQRPERSHLVLAPTPGRAGPGRLTAGELAELELGHVRLVVLAACQTIRSGRGRSAGYTGLVGSLLAAGAHGAVGTLWEVDDQRTRALMVEFHRAYRASGDAPAALRAAQLHLLRSGDRALRSPAAWAGFRYTGR